WRVVLAIVVAGIIADLDWFSANFGASAYLHWHRTATHSIAFAIAVALVAFLFSQFIPARKRMSWAGFSWIATAALLHILMDLLQADTVQPLWPFSTRRFSLDILPSVDPWLLLILAAAILFPELIRLVSDEIGARTKRPRGRNGAIAGLVLVLVYFAVRALFHANAAASLEARTITGEMPRRFAAF